jgi:hypothetical protein
MPVKAFVLSLASLLTAFVIGSFAAGAHESPVPHRHPHLHTLDGALMGYETLGLIALACVAATGLTLLLARIRRRK